MCAGCFIVWLCMHCSWSSSYQEGRVGIPLNGLILSHFCSCPKSGPEFKTSYGVVFFCVQWVKMTGVCLLCWYWWIDYHHFPFHNTYRSNSALYENFNEMRKDRAYREKNVWLLLDKFEKLGSDENLVFFSEYNVTYSKHHTI